MYKIFSIFLFFGIVVSYAQAPEAMWMKRYGGSSTESMRSLIKTDDGGYLLGGSSNSGISGIKTEARIGWNDDYWVVKTDNLGNIQWQKTIGGGNSVFFGDFEADILNEVRKASDGGYFLGGYSDSPVYGSKTEPNYGMQDYWIVKLNSTGNIVWQKAIGGSNYDECYTLEPTSDGGCIVGGYSKSGISGNKTDINKGLKDYWVVKLDANGQILWQKSYGGNSDDILYSILVLDTQEYILIGMSASNISGDKTDNSKGGGDFWIIKIDSVGNIIWQKTIGGNNADEPFNGVKVSDGFVFGGSSRSNVSFNKSENSRGGTDYWLIKTDFNGDVLWDKTFGGSLEDNLHSFCSLENGNGYVLSGSSSSGISGDKTITNFSSNYNGWVIRVNANGELLWQNGFGGSLSDGLNQVMPLSDGSIILGGNASSNVSGNLSVAGYGGNDYWLIQLEEEQLANNDFSNNDFYAYPNPVFDSLNIKFGEIHESFEIKVYNSLMQLIEKFQYNNISEIEIPINGSSGIYFIKISSNNGETFQTKVFKK